MSKLYNPKDYPFVQGNFAILGVRLPDGDEDNVTKVLKEEWYLFNDWYRVNDERDGLVRNGKRDVVRNLYGRNITFSAVAGKNGSGKSSLMGVIYRVLNNLSYLMTVGLERNAADPLYFVEDVYATVYFESDGKLGWVSCEDSDITFHWGDEDVALSYDWDNNELEEGLLEYNRQFIARHFCFTLVANYALFSLTSDEFSRDEAKRNPIKAMQRKTGKDDSEKHTGGEWIDSIYNKNDGYQACFGIEPYKGEGNLNLDTQRELALERTAALFILSGENPVFDNYCYHHLDLKLDEDCAARSVNDGWKREDWSRHPANELKYNLEKEDGTVSDLILNEYGYRHINFEDKTATQLAAYIVIKTLTIIQRYDHYAKYRFLGKPVDYACSPHTPYKKYLDKLMDAHADIDGLEYPTNGDVAEAACKELRDDRSHITLKLRQALNMMDVISQRYAEDPDWLCPEITDFETFWEGFYAEAEVADMQYLLEHMPPSVFTQGLYLHKQDEEQEIPFGDLSSGEKQFLQTTTTILYHLRNIISVKEQYGFAKYYNISLILDELEVCFHPEYQQKFVKMLKEMLQNAQVLNHVNINVLLVTHSPFVLSDIPKCNVLCLEDGKVKKDLHETFCANIFDLLSGHFFLDQFVGYFASEFTDSVIKQVYRLCDPNKRVKYLQLKKYKEVREKVALIGDDIIRIKLIDMLDSHLREGEAYEHLRNEKERLEYKLNQIKDRLEDYDAH